MQIQPTSAANLAAGSISQATSRDRFPGGVAEAAQISSPAGVERIAGSEATDADRDAQGGGQGLDARAEQAAEEDAAPTKTGSGLSVISPEPPSQLDIIG